MKIKLVPGYQIYIHQQLGRGSYGIVYKGKNENTNESIAVKMIQNKADYFRTLAVKNQIDVLQKVQSENIVKFYDFLESNNHYYIMQQLCDGDLSQDIKPNLHHPQTKAIQMIRQICNGFLALVRQGIIHRDLKPANILKKGKILKLCDFGFSKQLQKQQSTKSKLGTPLYNSWEILKGGKYTSKCDVWALGIIFYELLHGVTPWKSDNEIQLLKNIQKHIQPQKCPLKFPRDDLSQATIDFINGCLQVQEKNRLSWDQVFSHPLFEDYFIKNEISHIFQNKMKTIMNKLRFCITALNLDLKMIIASMGFNQNKKKIDLQDFHSFFQIIYRQITSQETSYCFRKIDKENNGSISANQLEQMLIENGINLEPQCAITPFVRIQSGEQSFNRVSKESGKSIQRCFKKLHRIMQWKGYTLMQVFNSVDNGKGKLTFDQFSHLIKRVSSTTIQITTEQIRMGFEIIDQDNSNSIEFSELKLYYQKINGISKANKQLKQYHKELIGMKEQQIDTRSLPISTSQPQTQSRPPNYHRSTSFNSI